MGAQDRIRLGEDGIYRLVEEEPAAKASGEAGGDAERLQVAADEAALSSAGFAEPAIAEAGSGAAGAVPAGEGGAAGKAAGGVVGAVHDPRIPTTISSSMSGPGVGDEVAARRASLLYAKGEPRLGRREAPEPYDPRPKRIMYAKGIAAGLVVTVLVVALVIVLGSGSAVV